MFNSDKKSIEKLSALTENVKTGAFETGKNQLKMRILRKSCLNGFLTVIFASFRVVDEKNKLYYYFTRLSAPCTRTDE